MSIQVIDFFFLISIFVIPILLVSNTQESQQNIKNTNMNNENRNLKSINGENDEDNWREVKRKNKENKENKIKKENKREEPNVKREELEFYFDEELDAEVPTGRQNAFTEEIQDEEDSDELSDRDVNKLLIVTQIPPTRAPKHDGHDRTGDWTTRVKMSQDLIQVINDGLTYYEEDLWVDSNYVCTLIIYVFITNCGVTG